MNELQSLILDAGNASIALDAAKHNLEVIKQQIDDAKVAIDEAKRDLDEKLDQCEAAGLSKAKAKKAIEGLKEVFSDIGATETPEGSDESSSAEAKPKKRRGRRRKDDTVEADTSSVEVSSQETETSSEQQDAKDADEKPASVPVLGDEIDSFIEENTHVHDRENVANLLADVVKEYAGTDVSEIDLSMVRECMKNAVDTGSAAARETRIWLVSAIDAYEKGDGIPASPSTPVNAEETAEEWVEENSETLVAEAESADASAVAAAEVGETYTVDPETGEITDNDSFPIEGDAGSEGEIVENIGDLNFLDESQVEKAPDETEEGDDTKPADKTPAPPSSPSRGSFKPSFMVGK